MYGFSTTFDGAFDDAVTVTTEALAQEGFGVLTEIDVSATLKKKLDVDMPRYLILGACNPGLAHQAIGAEVDIGLLLPCNVVVREDKAGEVVVAFMDPESVLSIVDNPAVGDVGSQVRAKMQRVCDAVGGSANAPRERSAL